METLGNTEPQKRIEWVAIVQIVSMILIVAHHSVSKYCQYPSYVSEFHTTFSRIGLTAFMFVSGYLLSKNNSIVKYGYLQYLKKRAIRLLTPYFVVQIALFLPKLAVVYLTDNLSQDLVDELFNILLRPHYAVCPHLWFLPALFILNVTSPLYFRLLKNKIACSFFLIVCFIISNTNIPCGDIATISEIKLYLFWYMLGIVTAARCFFFDSLFGNQRKTTITVLCSLVLFIILKRASYSFECRDFGGLIYLFSLLVVIGIGVGLPNFGVVNGQFLKNFTFPIYILSLPIQNIFEVFGKNYVHSWVATSAIMFLVGLVLPVIITKIVKRFEFFAKTNVLSLCIGA